MICGICFACSEKDTGTWEKVVHDLARMCGLNVPESKLEKLSKLGSTFLVKRFDRNHNKITHFVSAMTLFGKTDGASAADGTSYLSLWTMRTTVFRRIWQYVQHLALESGKQMQKNSGGNTKCC